eukprot:1640485-Rhodomonas_salina.3
MPDIAPQTRRMIQDGFPTPHRKQAGRYKHRTANTQDGRYRRAGLPVSLLQLDLAVLQTPAFSLLAHTRTATRSDR